MRKRNSLSFPSKQPSFKLKCQIDLQRKVQPKVSRREMIRDKFRPPKRKVQAHHINTISKIRKSIYPKIQLDYWKVLHRTNYVKNVTCPPVNTNSKYRFRLIIISRVRNRKSICPLHRYQLATHIISSTKLALMKEKVK